MVVDANGVRIIYTPKPNGFKWALGSKPQNDSHITGDADVVKDNGDGSFTFTSFKQIRFGISKDPSFTPDCNADFSKLESKGHFHNPDDPRDVEIKFFVKVNNGGGNDTRFGIGGPTGRHKSNTKCCSGFTYYSAFYTKRNPMVQRYNKEMWHVSYHPLDFISNTALANFKMEGHGWMGVGLVRFNKTITNTDGSTRTVVVLESWISPNGLKDEWFKFSTMTDEGGWGNDGDDCGGAKDQKGTWGNNLMRIMKITDSSLNYDFKWASIIEIDPFANTPDPGSGGGGGGSGDHTQNPQFGFVPLILKRHMNFERSSACTTVTPSQELYKQLTQNGDSDMKGTGYRAGEEVINTSSKFYNDIILDGKVYVRKTGTPPNNLFIRIRKGSDDSIKATLATITPASVNTTETEISFSGSNTYKMKVGDKFSLESDGNSSNYFSIYRDSNSSYDGSNSKRFTYEPTYASKSGDLKAILNGTPS